MDYVLTRISVSSNQEYCLDNNRVTKNVRVQHFIGLQMPVFEFVAIRLKKLRQASRRNETLLVLNGVHDVWARPFGSRLFGQVTKD